MTEKCEIHHVFLRKARNNKVGYCPRCVVKGMPGNDYKTTKMAFKKQKEGAVKRRPSRRGFHKTKGNTMAQKMKGRR